MQTNPHAQTVLPVSLLLEKRPCLIVGGGKVAARKAKLLLEAKAGVSVVAPQADEEIHRLAKDHALHYLPREFSESDLDGAFLVFAATNDKVVNRHVLKCCHARKMLCCSVDGNWTSSDFVTPAIFRNGLLTVSVSSGGRSCRRSRLVKDNLARHLEMVETADLIVIGTSHHQLPIQRREPLHLVGKRMDQTGQMLMQVWGIHEFMLLDTCNRIELIGIVSKETGIVELLKRIMAFFHLKDEEYYVKRGFEAFEHLAVVSAGLLSQSPGEQHIVAQVKEALDLSIARGWAGGMMQEWINATLHLSKDIRHVTGPLLQNREIEDLCVDFLKTECPAFANKRVAVLGTGLVGTGLIRRFLDLGHTCEWAYHVNKPDLPESWKKLVALSTFNDLPATLPKVEVIVCTASSPGYILHKGHAPFFDQTKEILMVDLAMPRNVEPALDNLTPNLKVVDLDGLKRWYQREVLDMAKVFELSKLLVTEHKDLYAKIVQSFASGNALE
ncbi:MAG: hypothetical protein HYV36_02980 [Lentisphaerae bacterium]|nr:hypothetical protein [Lentisphaerota bacterium]